MQVSTEQPEPDRCGHRPHHRLLRFNATARVALLVQASTTSALGWFSPNSLTARLLSDGGQIGQAMLVLMSMLVLGGWLDVLVNDLLPDGLSFPLARKHEHIGYLMLGGLYWVQAMGSAETAEPGAHVLLLNYMVMGGVCCWYGWVSAMRGGRHA